LFTPTGGFGMNTGVEDATNLAWKLAALNHGWGGPKLIESYQAERRPIAIRNLAQSYALADIKSAISVPEGVEDTGHDGDYTRQVLGHRFMTDLAEEYKCIGIQLGAQYITTPLIQSDGSEPPDDNPYVFIPSATPGCRSPHAWMADGTAIFDHFGKWFTLLRFDETIPIEEFCSVAASVGVPVNVLSVPETLRVYYEANLVLIRPDQYVAWRGKTIPRDPLALLNKVIGF